MASISDLQRREIDAIAPIVNRTRTTVGSGMAERVPNRSKIGSGIALGTKNDASKSRKNANTPNTQDGPFNTRIPQSFDPEDLRKMRQKRAEQTEVQEQGRTAIVMRGMDPLNQVVMNRLIELSDILRQEKFKNYDLHILLDQTKNNVTSTATIENFFQANNASHLKVPKLFSISEQMIRDEFPAFEKGYMTKPLVDGSTGICCGKPFMWQLLTPAMLVFSHYNQEYDFAWVYEDDVWSFGKPIVDVFHRWDEKMEGFNADLAAFKNERARMPYIRFMKERQTEGFRKVLMAMKATHWQRKNMTLLAMDNQSRSKVWNSWNDTVLPPWMCVSDSFYRHSRAFSQFLYDALSMNIFQFTECFQQPMAWFGGFNVTDLQAVLTGEEAASFSWEEGLFRKITGEEAMKRLNSYANTSIILYHEEFFPKPPKQK
eukprot:scaffold3618_cov129-Cylindrotheca_fusiformis.AAC.28